MRAPTRVDDDLVYVPNAKNGGSLQVTGPDSATCSRFWGFESSARARSHPTPQFVNTPGRGVLAKRLAVNRHHAVIKTQMASAEKAGIPIVSCSTVEQGKPGGFAAQCDSTEAGGTEELSKWMINDSGGEAHVLGLTLPLYPT